MRLAGALVPKPGVFDIAGEAGIEIDDFPAVAAWLARVEALPRFLPVLADAALEVFSFEQWFGEGGGSGPGKR